MKKSKVEWRTTVCPSKWKVTSDEPGQPDRIPALKMQQHDQSSKRPTWTESTVTVQRKDNRQGLQATGARHPNQVRSDYFLRSQLQPTGVNHQLVVKRQEREAKESPAAMTVVYLMRQLFTRMKAHQEKMEMQLRVQREAAEADRIHLLQQINKLESELARCQEEHLDNREGLKGQERQLQPQAKGNCSCCDKFCIKRKQPSTSKLNQKTDPRSYSAWAGRKLAQEPGSTQSGKEELLHPSSTPSLSSTQGGGNLRELGTERGPNFSKQRRLHRQGGVNNRNINGFSRKFSVPEGTTNSEGRWCE